MLGHASTANFRLNGSASPDQMAARRLPRGQQDGEPPGSKVAPATASHQRRWTTRARWHLTESHGRYSVGDASSAAPQRLRMPSARLSGACDFLVLTSDFLRQPSKAWAHHNSQDGSLELPSIVGRVILSDLAGRLRAAIRRIAVASSPLLAELLPRPRFRSSPVKLSAGVVSLQVAGLHCLSIVHPMKISGGTGQACVIASTTRDKKKQSVVDKHHDHYVDRPGPVLTTTTPARPGPAHPPEVLVAFCHGDRCRAAAGV